MPYRRKKLTFAISSPDEFLSSMKAARQLRRRTWFTQYRTSDVAENVRSTFLVQGVQPGERLWIDSKVKIKTRHPVKRLFGSEFPAICIRCVVMAAWSRKTWKFCEQFLRFVFWKTTPYGFQNSVTKVFTASPIDVVVFKFCEICPTGNPRNRALFSGQKKTKLRLRIIKLSNCR